uniref:Glycosyltransferase family 1 protein n=1 Tax=Globodera pallida TaxID=36090 RepID=A0A183BZA1_GLOPA
MSRNPAFFSTRDPTRITGFPGLADDLAVYKRFADRLLFIPFTDVGQYLHDLEIICHCLHRYGPNVLIYLAAAVSDFYIREAQLVCGKPVPPQLVSDLYFESR